MNTRHSHQAQRAQRIHELRHRLRYAAPHEREQVRTELEFWIKQG